MTVSQQVPLLLLRNEEPLLLLPECKIAKKHLYHRDAHLRLTGTQRLRLDTVLHVQEAQ